MLFTIITVCYNSENTIGKTLASIDAQSFKDYEHIIIDGQSTDGTLEIIERLSNQNRIVISEPDNGLYDAMNKGLSIAKGEYIFFLNSDDYLNNERVLEVVARDVKISPADILLYSIEYFGDGMSRKWVLKDDKRYLYTPYFVPPHPGFIIKNDFMKYLGLRFDLKYRICSDMKFMLESLRYSSNSVITSDFILTKMRSGGVSSKFLSRRLREFYLIYRDLGYSKIEVIVLIFKRYTIKLFQFI
jgi:glycosyltransferase involved in cell wall biosynthesis